MVLDPLERQPAHGQRGPQRQVEGAGVQQLHQIGLGVAHTGLLGLLGLSGIGLSGSSGPGVNVHARGTGRRGPDGGRAGGRRARVHTRATPFTARCHPALKRVDPLPTTTDAPSGVRTPPHPHAPPT
ncbi:hypothetical protein GCM10010282_45100 [Streptomyces roseolus]|nr:hypothetical protein GCM10010282_45100 [Streptomyces roseolus]